MTCGTESANDLASDRPVFSRDMLRIGRALGFELVLRREFGGSISDAAIESCLMWRQDGVLVGFAGDSTDGRLIAANAHFNIVLKEAKDCAAALGQEGNWGYSYHIREDGSEVLICSVDLRAGFGSRLASFSERGEFLPKWVSSPSHDLSHACFSADARTASDARELREYVDRVWQEVKATLPEEVRRCITPETPEQIEAFSNTRRILQLQLERLLPSASQDDNDFARLLTFRLHPATDPAGFVLACNSLLRDLQRGKEVLAARKLRALRAGAAPGPLDEESCETLHARFSQLAELAYPRDYARQVKELLQAERQQL